MYTPLQVYTLGDTGYTSFAASFGPANISGSTAAYNSFIAFNERAMFGYEGKNRAGVNTNYVLVSDANPSNPKPIAFRNGSNSYINLFLTTTSRVGIGGNVTNPSATVEIVSTSTIPILRLTSFGGTSGSVLTASHSGIVGVGTTTPYAKLSVAGTDVATTTFALRPIASQTANIMDIYSTAGALSSVVTSSGNWGIGTSTPDRLLTVSGATSATTTIETRTANINPPGLEFRANVTGNNLNIGNISFNNSSNGNSTLANIVGFQGTSVIQGALIFSTRNSTSFAERMRIDTTGNIGIGTSSPASKLAITQSANTPAGGLWIAETGNTDFRSIYMSDTSGTLSFFGGDTAGSLNTATLNSAGAWTNASDRSYKENIVDLNTKYNLDTLLSIQPRFYTMKGTGKPQIGFIAQELKLVLPEVVEGQEGTMGISYGNMVALLVTAIKDLNGKVEKVANWFKDDKLNIQSDICVDNVCITKEQFKEMLLNSGAEVKNTQKVKEENNNSNANSTEESNNQATTTPEIVIDNASSTPNTLPDDQNVVVPEPETNPTATSTNP